MKRCPSCTAACWDTHRHCPSCGADVSTIAPDEGDAFIGTTLVGKYQMLELIGVGAMGRVYRALHLGLDTQVAVKVLNAEIASDAVSARRFQNEARASSRLHHPNAIAILDFGQSPNGTLYLVMEFLRGRTLAQLVRDEGAVRASRIADLLGQALGALDEAHAAGIIHRDFKPENIFIETLRSGREHTKVLDFGIAKLRGEQQETSLTSAGLVCGTPDYMSPEQVRGLELDPRSDVYSAGVVLYEALTGRRLFEGVTALIDVLQAHVSRDPEPPSVRRPDLSIPPEIEAVCMRALAKDANERYSTALELRSALEQAGQAGRERCPKCNAPRTGARFCGECGALLPVLTPAGGVALPPALMPSLTVPTVHDSSLPPARAPTELASTALPPPPSLVFCGREAVLARLMTLDRSVAFIVGERGSGKSCVAHAWAERRRANGRRVVIIEVDGAGLVPPLQPLRRAVSAVLDVSETVHPDTLAEVLAQYSDDRAGIATLFAADRGRSTLPLDTRRRECRAASIAVLRRADVDLVFDDVHLYDTVSRQLVDELVDHPGAATVLITASRPDALAGDLARVETVQLGGLDALELSSLGVPQDIIARSGGLPFLVENELRARAEGAREGTTQARLEALSPDARRVVQLLAVAGAPLHRGHLDQAANLTDLDATVAELNRRGFLLVTHETYRLASPTLRREVYECIDPDRRAAMHARLGAVLERAGIDLHFVAYHALLTGDGEPQRLAELGDAPVLSPVDGIAALERAGAAARDGFDDATACRALRAAMERSRIALMHGLGDEGQLMRIELKLGVVLRYAGDLAGAGAVLREAAQLAQERGERWALVESRRALARVASASGRSDRACEELRLAVKTALTHGDPALLCSCYLELGEALVQIGQQVEAAQELEEGILMVTQGDGPEAEHGPAGLALAVARLASLRVLLSAETAAAKLAQHALRLASESSGIERARVSAICADVMHSVGRHDEAAGLRRRAVAELRSLGDRRSTAEQLIALSDELVRDPSLQERRKEWLIEAERLAREIDWGEGTSRSQERLRSLG